MTPASTPQRPVPVVRLIIPNAEGAVLLLKRVPGVTGGEGWCLPGGKIDYGETAFEAARRELAEETRLEGVDLRYLFYQDSLPVEPGAMHCINHYFHCTVTGDLELDSESSRHAWVTPAELDRYSIVFRNREGLERYWDEG
ncbi:MAG TPA: NUDIX domain-containing protein [Longimicrobiales bacterium]|nr:NUDIX domain-containing protein [Longimicrobiales bacterium]